MAKPGPVDTKPTTEVFLNMPLFRGQETQMEIANKGTKRIGWTVTAKGEGIAQLQLKPDKGALNPQEKTVVDIGWIGNELVCSTENPQLGPFVLVLDWVDAPNDTDPFLLNWFYTTGFLRRKNIPIRLNK